MKLTYSSLLDSLRTQLDDVVAAAERARGQVAYIKPHGALYHACASLGTEVQALIACAKEYRLGVLHQCGSTLSVLASSSGIPIAYEGFADRRYTNEGLLVDRSQVDAVLADHTEVALQSLRLAQGSATMHAVDSICFHGDHDEALANARHVREVLERGGFQLARCSTWRI